MLLAILLCLAVLPRSILAAPISLDERQTSLLGTLTVQSSRQANIYLQVVTQQNGPMEIIAPMQAWSRQFEVLPLGGGGVAVKMRSSPDPAIEPLQMEYTVDPGMSKVFYDVSTIDGTGGFPPNWTLTPAQVSDPANPTCVVVDISDDYYDAGEGNDATMSCHLSNNLTLVLY